VDLIEVKRGKYMVQVIRRTPQAPKINKGKQFAEAVQGSLKAYADYDTKIKQDEAVSDYLGFDVSNFDPETRKEIVKQTAKTKARSQYFGDNDPLSQPQPGAFSEQLQGAPVDVQTGETPASEYAGETEGQKIKKLENQLENFQYEDEDDNERPKITKPKLIPMPGQFKEPYSQEQISRATGYDLREGSELEKRNANARKAHNDEVKRIQTHNDSELNRHQREIHFNKEYDLKARKQNQSEKTENKKIKEKTAPLENALKSVNMMKQLRKKGNLGVYSKAKGIFSSQTRTDRAKYQTLGNSLISFAASIPIRNKLEFEQLTGMLNDPNITDESAAGVLDALETIIKGSMKAYDEDEEETSKPSKKTGPTVEDFI
jgi:hypothetical protein